MTRHACPTCGTPLTCQSCHGRRAGAAGGRTRTAARVASAKHAATAPRPGRRVFDLSWTPARRDLPERASLAEAARLAVSRNAAADLVTEGVVVGRVEADGSWRLDR